MTPEGKAKKILCVDRSDSVYHQAKSIFLKEKAEIVLEKRIDRVLDRFEEETFDVLIFSSSAGQTGNITSKELLEIISANCSITQIVVLVNPGEFKLAMDAIRAGSYQYAKLPIGDEELRMLIDNAIQNRPHYGTNLLLKEEWLENKFEQMVGGSEAMRSVYGQIRQAAMTDIPVLLTGETGTGKDLAARAIHQLSERAARPFLPVNLGALPEGLVASELFGYEKGAFTGSTTRHLGSFERANEGTVFLDEILAVDEKVQVSLLRLLETKELYRLGGKRKIKVDIRVISATNEDLREAVDSGVFREDLLFRLDVLRIHMPPLRTRLGDLPLLVNHFMGVYAKAYKKDILNVTPECMSFFNAYEWPGNVRELKNVLMRAVVVCEEKEIRMGHLPQGLRSKRPVRPMIHTPIGTSLADMERELVKRTLVYTGNNRQRAAALLGISRRALYNKIERFGIK